MMGRYLGFAMALLLAWVAGPVYAARISVKSVTASSSKPDSEGVSYRPELTLDGKVSTYWAEGEAAAGLGDFLDFDFGQEVTLTRIVIYNGNWDSREFYQRHNRAKRFQVKFSNKTSADLAVADKMDRQVLILPQPTKTSSLRMILKDVYAGTTFNDTCVAEVQFLDDTSDSLIEGIGATATSALPPDSAGSYGADRLLDGMRDLVWCEGKKDGPGINETITLTLPAETAIGEIRLVNGVSSSEEVYRQNNRVVRLRVQVGPGPAKELELADQFDVMQSFPLEGAKGKLVKLTVLEVARGTKFNDTCLSELELRRVSSP